MKAAKPDWAGQTVVCIASGPSLTADDCEAVRQTGNPTVVTNSTFRACPWADVLFAFDAKWWRAKNTVGEPYYKEAKRIFKGRLVSVSPEVTCLGVETTYMSTWFHEAAGNSGSCALAFAIAGQPRRIVMLGYDAAEGPNGEKHHHPDHPAGMSNCRSMQRWPKEFQQVAAAAKVRGVRIVNASRRTALTCFERVDLATALQ